MKILKDNEYNEIIKARDWHKTTEAFWREQWRQSNAKNTKLESQLRQIRNVLEEENK